MEPESVPLFAFATAQEFSGVFPQDSAGKPGDLIPLNGSFQGCYACILGVGILEFSTALAFLLHQCKQRKIGISAVINLGICGAFPQRGLSLLDVVQVSSDQVGDLGCEEADGTHTVWNNSYQASSPEMAPLFMVPILEKLSQKKGITVNCCTGTQRSAQERVKQLNCDVESMEGAACFAVCQKFGIPAYQIRAVSNMASQRDKASWKIPEALDVLRQMFR